MAYGDVVQVAASTLAIRAASPSSVDVAITGVGANNVLVAIALSRVSGGQSFTCVETGAAFTLTERCSEAEGARMTHFWSVENVGSGNYTIRFSWTGAAPQYSQFLVVEMQATADTVFDLRGRNYYSEEPFLAARTFTTPGIRNFAIALGLQWYQNATFNNTPVGSTIGVFTVHSQYGVFGANQWGAALAAGTYDEPKALYAEFDFATAAGASVDADGLILAWVDPSGETMDSPSGGTEANYLVNTEVSQSNSARTSITLTLFPAPTVGNLLVASLHWDDVESLIDDPLTVDDLVTDGWTRLVTAPQLLVWAKIATGSDDTSLVVSWTPPVLSAMLYAELDSTGFDAAWYTPGTYGEREVGGIVTDDDGPYSLPGIEESLWLTFVSAQKTTGAVVFAVAQTFPTTWDQFAAGSSGTNGVAGYILAMYDSTGATPWCFNRPTSDDPLDGQYLVLPRSTDMAMVLMARVARVLGEGPQLRLQKMSFTELPYQLHTRML